MPTQHPGREPSAGPTTTQTLTDRYTKLGDSTLGKLVEPEMTAANRSRWRRRATIADRLTTEIAREDAPYELLARALEVFREFIEADRSVACSVEIGGAHFEPRPELFHLQDGVTRKGRETLCRPNAELGREAAQLRAAVAVDDALMGLGLLPSERIIVSPYRSMLCAPLLERDELLALVYMESLTPGAFSIESVEDFAFGVNLISDGFARALRHRALEHRRLQLEQSYDRQLKSQDPAALAELLASLAISVDGVIHSLRRTIATAPSTRGKQAAALAEAERQAEHLESLRVQLQSLGAVPGDDDRVPVRLDTIVLQSVTRVAPSADKRGVSIDTHFQYKSPTVAAEAGRLGHVLDMLLEAALAELETGAKLRLSVTREGAQLQVAATLTGQANVPQTLDLVRTIGALGMFACRRVIDDHGGELALRDDRHPATVFRVRLPRVPLVLAVDDDEDVRTNVAALLRHQGFLVLTARDGQEALELLETQTPDAVVTDIQMPRIDGWEFVRRLRADSRLAAVPVLFLTSVEGMRAFETGFQLGADDFLTKRETAQLPARVEAALRRRAYAEAELEHYRGRSGATFEGSLDQLSLPALLTMLEMERREGIVEVEQRHQGQRAELAIRGGQLLGARMGDEEFSASSPIEILRTTLTWKSGRFAFVPQALELDESDSVVLQAALIDSARLQDETGRTRHPSPSTH